LRASCAVTAFGPSNTTRMESGDRTRFRTSSPGRAQHRRDDGVRWHRQARRAPRLPRQSGLPRELRAAGRPRRTRRRAERHAALGEPDRRGRASAVRRLGRPFTSGAASDISRDS
jgi:hypothetical protein